MFDLITPVPKIAEYEDCNSLLTGKSREAFSKLHGHIEESNASLKRVKEEFFDKKRFHEFLSERERRHLMINIVDVEHLTTSLSTWFKTCQGRIPAVCGLITNILDYDYLQPMMNFAVYSHVQMNMIESIRHCIDSTGNLTEHDDEETNTLTFTDIQTILLKQANWLNKFHSLIHSVHGCLAAEMTKEESVIQEFEQCSYKLKQIINNSNEHEKRIINNMDDHSTSLVHKLQFTAEEVKDRTAQKLMVYEESWVKKKGTVTVLDVRKRKRKQSIEKKKLTMIVFVNTVLIVQPNADSFKVVDCMYKKNIQFQNGSHGNVQNNFGIEEIENIGGGEIVRLTHLDPVSVSRYSIKKYLIHFENRKEILEWSKVLEYSEEENLAQELEYFTPLEMFNKTKEQCSPEDQRKEQNDREVEILLGIADLNKKTIKSLSKLNQSYINDGVLDGIIGEGEKHHLYLNILEVKDVIESFDSGLESNRQDSVAYFSKLNNQLKEDSFKPIIKYQANMCFQQNMLQFQRKHKTTFIEVLGKFGRTKCGVSEMDLQLRLSRPPDWLTCLYRKSKALTKAFKGHVDQPHHRLQIDTLQRLEQLIKEEKELTKSVDKDLHMTTVLINLPIPSSRDPQLLQNLSNIKDDWLKKHGCFTLYTKRNTEESSPLMSVRKRYSQKESIHIYASTSVIIVTSKQSCNCYDRNYADIEVVDARNRKSWMPEKGFSFKLWIYEKVGREDDYRPVEYLLELTSESEQIEKEFMEWKTALVVSTGESGKYDDYTRPRHIISKPFTTDRDNELELEVNDFVELIEYREAIGTVWVKGIRYKRGGVSGWFPREILGREVDSEYNIGQKIKLQFQKEREKEVEADKGGYRPIYTQVIRKDNHKTTTRKVKKSEKKEKSKRFSFGFSGRKHTNNTRIPPVPFGAVTMLDSTASDGTPYGVLTSKNTATRKDRTIRFDTEGSTREDLRATREDFGATEYVMNKDVATSINNRDENGYLIYGTTLEAVYEELHFPSPGGDNKEETSVFDQNPCYIPVPDQHDAYGSSEPLYDDVPENSDSSFSDDYDDAYEYDYAYDHVIVPSSTEYIEVCDNK
ncbi:uncharacterized protein [Antedon mediterranea]|uniref:uncharacterized protein n=1 Tax=Antedon mediterranea TaxID=105859 RepID=UPI003AF78A0D